MQDDNFTEHKRSGRVTEKRRSQSTDTSDDVEEALAVPNPIACRLHDKQASPYELCKWGLSQAFLKTSGLKAMGKWGSAYDYYAIDVTANLLEGVPFDNIRHAFDDGKGQELLGGPSYPPKMAAIYSSSALVVNTFGPWHCDPSQLVINGHRGFTRMMFEAQVPTGLGGTPPHLDLRLDADDRVLAIESKCLEYLVPKQARFASAYETITDHRAQSPWFRHIAMLRKEPGHYRYLDAAQLIKHYLGLAHSVPGKSITLLYLYWEPYNGQDFDPFTQHRAEIHEFSQTVAGDSVRFEAMSYNELWMTWERLTKPAWLSAQLLRLKARYSIGF